MREFWFRFASKAAISPSIRLALATTMASLAVIMLTPGLAMAVTSYAYSTTFDSGQSLGGAHAVGLAVDTSTSPSDPSAGDVYVSGGSVVNRFSAASAAAGAIHSRFAAHRFWSTLMVSPSIPQTVISTLATTLAHPGLR